MFTFFMLGKTLVFVEYYRETEKVLFILARTEKKTDTEKKGEGGGWKCLCEIFKYILLYIYT